MIRDSALVAGLMAMMHLARLARLLLFRSMVEGPGGPQSLLGQELLYTIGGPTRNCSVVRTCLGHRAVILDDTNYEAFCDELRKVLQNLYDPGILRRSLLVPLFNLSGRPNPVASLMDVILNAIRALKPDRNLPPQANALRIYHVLLYRYVEQTSQPIVAHNLSLSVRQLRRLEREAKDMLANYLWKHYKLEEKMPLALASNGEAGSRPGGASDGIPSREMELEWLRGSFPRETASIPELMGSVLKAIRPLTEAYRTRFIFTPQEDLPPVSGQLAVVRQAIASLLSAMMQAAPGEEITISEDSGQGGVWVNLTLPAGRTWMNPPTENGSDYLTSARQLLAIFQGRFEVLRPGVNSACSGVRLFLPVEERIPVLVVDDNSDTLRLFQRYLAGTHYLFIGAKDARQALELLEENPPRIVVLDVMMPGVDDWEMLGRIQEHPQTHGVSVVVCTILPQERLAKALGATAFLRKPVSRQGLLSTLDQQLAQFSTRSP